MVDRLLQLEKAKAQNTVYYFLGPLTRGSLGAILWTVLCGEGYRMKNPGLSGFVIETCQSHEQAALERDSPQPQPVLREVQSRPNLEHKSKQEKGINPRFYFVLWNLLLAYNVAEIISTWADAFAISNSDHRFWSAPMQPQVRGSSSETLLTLSPRVPRKARKTQVCVCCKLASFSKRCVCW